MTWGRRKTRCEPSTATGCSGSEWFRHFAHLVYLLHTASRSEGGLPELPTGTVTCLFTDLEGSTRLWEEQREAMRGALARHDEILLSAISAQDGFVVKQTGDGVHAAFATAAGAVGAATAAQQALQR